MRLLLPILLLLGCTPLRAGLWDRDRPETLPDEFSAITGHFDRLPEAYYRARLQRITPVLDALPAKPATEAEMLLVADALPLFDDAAVAEFRLGNLGRAISLLSMKAERAEAIRATLTARARTADLRGAANRAACLQIGWRRSGDDRNLNEAKTLLREILADDKHNSDAQWSLVEIEWLISPPAWQAGGDPVFPNLLGLRDASFRGTLDDSAAARNNVAGCLAFLGRRIVYEDGWRDLDVMYAYSLALALTGRSEEALFAWFRIVELIDTGATSHVAGAPGGTQLKRIMGKHVEEAEGREDAEKLYVELRRHADEWVESRNAYVTAQVQLKRHPDTDPAFWAGWSQEDPKAIEPEDETDAAISTVLLVGGLGGLMVVMLLILGFSVFLGRRTAPPPSVDEL